MHQRSQEGSGRLRSHAGAYLEYGDALNQLMTRYPGDLLPATGYREPSEYGERIGEGKLDAWGAVWLRATDEHKGLVVGHPLADWENLDSYQFPDPLKVGDWSEVPQHLARNAGEKYVLVDGDTLFQRMFYLRGFEALMLDLAEERPETYYLRDKILAFMLRKIGRHRPAVHPAIWRPG